MPYTEVRYSPLHYVLLILYVAIYVYILYVAIYVYILYVAIYVYILYVAIYVYILYVAIYVYILYVAIYVYILYVAIYVYILYVAIVTDNIVVGYAVELYDGKHPTSILTRALTQRNPNTLMYAHSNLCMRKQIKHY